MNVNIFKNYFHLYLFSYLKEHTKLNKTTQKYFLQIIKNDLVKR